MPNKCLKVKGVNRFDVFLMYTGFAYMILDQNLFTVILSEKKCYSISNIAFLEIVLQIATIILEIPTGIIGDFVSRKILLISARILYILYAIIFLNSNDIYAMGLAFVLLGISESLISGTEESIIAEISDQKQVKKYMYFSSVVQISTIVSIILGGVLYSINWKYIYITMIVSQAISIISIGFVHDSHQAICKIGTSKNYFLILKNEFVKVNTLKTVILGAAFGGLCSVYMIYMPLIFSKRGLSSIQISFFFVLQMIASFAITFIVGKVAEDIDEKRICVLSCVLFLIGGVMNLSYYIFINVLGGLMCCMGGTLFFPAITSIINNKIPDEIRTTGNSIVNMIQTGFMCIVLLLIGFITK